MALRLLRFVVWGFLGMALSYASVYALTPYGLALILFVSISALLLVTIWDSAWPDSIGLAAGPGAFCLLLAANSDVNQAAFGAAGVAIISAASAWYVLVMRVRCAQGRLSGP
jgi:hypothetical protein